MARCVMIAAILAMFVGASVAQLKICDSNKVPGAPWNTLLTSNTYDAGAKQAKLALTWRSPVKSSSDGCVDQYRLSFFKNGAIFKTQNIAVNPAQEKVETTVNVPAGEIVAIKVEARNTANGKTGPMTGIATVTTAKAPVTATPL